MILFTIYKPHILFSEIHPESSSNSFSILFLIGSSSKLKKGYSSPLARILFLLELNIKNLNYFKQEKIKIQYNSMLTYSSNEYSSILKISAALNLSENNNFKKC